MRKNIDAILDENNRRLKVINNPYDPLVGTQYCDINQRDSIDIVDAPLPLQYIPIEMEQEPVVQLLLQTHSLEKATKQTLGKPTQKNIIRLWRAFCKLRCRYDFENWCCTEIKIKLKGLAQRDYFILNRAQRFYLQYLEQLRKAGVPIDIILLKARQWGGSTLTQFYMFWIQKMLRKHWNSVICGDVEKQSKVVLAMLENAAADYDTFIDDGNPTILKPYGRTESVRIIQDRQCTITVGSAQKPDKVRGEDTSMAHLTEVGLWKETLGKKPEDLIESIIGGMLQGPYTLLVLESTAKGVGNYFYNAWNAACNHENNLTPVFVPWYMIDMYSKPIFDYTSFIESMTDYEWWQFDEGATLEAINWYRHKSKTMDEMSMRSEYPTTAEEAFQSTGAMYFKRNYITELQQSCRKPKYIGEIVCPANNQNKAAYLSNLRFEQMQHGHLQIWEDVDKKTTMRNRYLVTVDLGKGGSADADNTIVCVFDRYWQQRGEDGYPEVVAEWAGKESETDLLAWRIAQIAAYYNNALLVIESNTIDSSKEDRFRAVLDEIKDYYPNLYKRPIVNKQDVGNTGGFRYGWNTNHQSKEEICADLDWAMREGMYVERSEAAITEMKIFERHQDGSLGNVEGKGNHDDRVITRALGIHFCYKKMDAPFIVQQSDSTTAGVTRKVINDMTI